MTHATAQPASARMNSSAFLDTASPLRYGVVAVIVISLVYAIVHIGPMLRRDVGLVHDVYSVDQNGAALEGRLLYEVQGSRLHFLHALLLAGTPVEFKAEIQSMRDFDSQVVATEAQVAQLGLVSEASRQKFHENWQAYLTRRDALMAKALEGGSKLAFQIDPLLGADRLQSTEQVIQETQAFFQAASATHIRELSQALNGALREFFIIVGVKIVALALLLWIDIRRIRAEKQLSKTTKNLHASETRFMQAYETTMVGMGIFKIDGTVLSVNRKGAKLLGYEVEELIGKKISDFMAPECKDDHVQQIATLPQTSETSYQAERRVLRRDGTSVWVRNSVTLLQPEGEEGHYFSITEEITAQKEANDRLAYLANFDPVTNLMNRHSFEQKLAGALKATSGTTECVAILYVEIDSFDFLHGTFGHSVADEVLAELGASLLAYAREDEVVARLDDHAFAVMGKAAPYDEATVSRGTDLQNLFHRAGETGKHRIPLSASIGIAYSIDETGGDLRTAGTGSEAETLLKFARAAMLEARFRGGDSIFVADPGLKQRAVQRHQIELALLNGLREEEFRVVFQPQFEVGSGKLVRFEALCRWNSRELGQIPPDRFIPIAEQTGLIMEIGRRILFDALSQAKTWTDAGRRIGVAVNISPMQFMRPDFTNLITEVLAFTQFPPALLELEITEGIFIRDLNLAVVRIRELQRLGLSIALDDFGTGYSSLSYLQKMPIDAVKLDRSFVSDLTTDPATVSMVRSVLAMAEALNLRVVTEGVETEQQLEILRALGCDEAQGYLLGRPEAADLALQRVLDSPMYPVEMAEMRVVR